MGTSINTNIAAYFAQANINAASNAAQSNVARLSSGNAIVQASDNVAALATGTSLLTQVSALRTAQSNAAQGSSLLQVADGALSQIQSILQQQQSISLQAKSGSLTNVDRGFLNQQFQALSNEINILATGTTFNGVALIDGSIAQGGSTSSNPLNNKGVVLDTAKLTIGGGVGGFTDVSNSSKASTTYRTGAFVAGATHFTSGGTIGAPPSGGDDKSLYGALGTTGNFVTHAVKSGGNFTGYVVDYTAADGTIYEGTLTAAADGHVAAAATLSLTAKTDIASHATINFVVDGTGYVATSDNSALLSADLKANIGTVAGTGVTFTSGSFNAAPTLGGLSGTKADASLHGDLSQGGVSVQYVSNTTDLATALTNTTTDVSAAKGYLVTYTINGQKYQGVLANSDGSAGHLDVATAANLVLTATNNGVADTVNHSTITFVTNTAFGGTTHQSDDQSNNIISALKANLAGSTALNTTKAGTITGETSQAGIGSVSYTSNPTKNDTAFVGDLSKGLFTVSGNTTTGYSVSYALNGSTYQGNISAAQIKNGGTFVLDNGTGSLAFALTGGSANSATSTALQSALTTQFAGATAHATHTLASALVSDGQGGTIPGSAITAASVAGTILDGFDGSKVTLTSSLYDGGAANTPPISNFAATGTGANVVFSVNIGGTTYSTQGVVSDTTGNLAGDTFDGATGILNFYKNGDKTANPSEVLKIDLASIGTSAKINTADAVTNVVNALNGAFGGGGSSGSGGLTFQLGTTSLSNVTVNIASAKTTALYDGASLNISTAEGAATAATTIAEAIDTVTSLRAGVGALGSQFNFASAAIQSSVQNQDAARGSLLDTDISTESTAFATNQVKLQAGISVLAQANQQLQALLKLIG